MAKNKKTALIFGITGQDGSYLSDLLLKKIIKSMGLLNIFLIQQNHFVKKSLPRSTYKKS